VFLVGACVFLHPDGYARRVRKVRLHTSCCPLIFSWFRWSHVRCRSTRTFCR
jgi:hypothetical protein